MFKKLYDQLWDLIDVALYALWTGIMFALWITIF